MVAQLKDNTAVINESMGQTVAIVTQTQPEMIQSPVKNGESNLINDQQFINNNNREQNRNRLIR